MSPFCFSLNVLNHPFQHPQLFFLKDIQLVEKKSYFKFYIKLGGYKFMCMTLMWIFSTFVLKHTDLQKNDFPAINCGDLLQLFSVWS